MTYRFLYLISCIATLCFAVSCQDEKQTKHGVLTVAEISAREYARFAADSCNKQLIKDPKRFSNTDDGVTVRMQTKEITFLNYISESDWMSNSIWNYLGYNQSLGMHYAQIYGYEVVYTLVIDSKSGEIFDITGIYCAATPTFCSSSDLFANYDDKIMLGGGAACIYIWRQTDDGKVVKVGELPLADECFAEELIWIDSCTLIAQVHTYGGEKVTHIRIDINLNACQDGESAQLFHATHEEWNQIILGYRFEDALHKGYLENKPEYFNPQIPTGIGIVNPKQDSICVFADTQQQMGSVVNKLDQELLIPLFNKPHYEIFYLSVSRDCGDYYEVYANAQKKVYVLKSEVEFIPLNELLKRSLCIHADEAYPSKGDSSLVVSLNYSPIVVSVDGDWVEVIDKEDDQECDAQGVEKMINDDSLPRYWIRWREGNRMLYSLAFIR